MYPTQKITLKNLHISPLQISFISGLLMALTTAPVSGWPLAWIALAPFWVLIVSYEKQKKAEKRQKLFLLPLAWGIGYHGLALSWILGIHPMTWLGVPWWPSLAIALFCWVFITLWGAALVVVWTSLFTLLNFWLWQKDNRSPGVFTRVLIGTGLWCALESLWSSSPLWWTSLSYTQSPYNLAILHLGQLSGPTTITAVIVAVNGLIAEAWIHRQEATIINVNRKYTQIHADSHPSSAFFSVFQRFLSKIHYGRYGGLAVILLLFLHVLGFYLYSRPVFNPPETALKIGVIQGNIPNQIKFNSQGWRRALEGYTTGYEALATQGVDAVLVPETALPFIWTNTNQLSYLSFYQAILKRGVVAWVGGFGKEGNSLTNSLFTINSKGEIVSRYDKEKLVPLGEYIPFEQLIGSIINRLSPLDEHLVAGKSNQLFDTPFGRAVVGICYDSAFSEHFRRQVAAGGEFILTASNDAHYTAAMMAQHQAQDVMRGIETDRWVVRATNTGYSAFVNPRGETIWMSKINNYEVQADTIYRRQTQTLYVRWGDWLTPLLLILGALAKVFPRL